ncbi:hypothetical protein SRHO_G00299750 [Serrasalmus rhombeus]
MHLVSSFASCFPIGPASCCHSSRMKDWSQGLVGNAPVFNTRQTRAKDDKAEMRIHYAFSEGLEGREGSPLPERLLNVTMRKARVFGHMQALWWTSSLKPIPLCPFIVDLLTTTRFSDCQTDMLYLHTYTSILFKHLIKYS